MKDDNYIKDGIVGAYYELNRKINEINNLLSRTDLSNIDMAARDDASFERMMKLFVSIGEISDTMKKLKQDHNLSGEEEVDSKRVMPFMEKMAYGNKK